MATRNKKKARSEWEAEHGYKVGYGKPPASRQFRPGQSGNPNGRPKGSKNLRSIARSTLLKTVTIPGRNGRPQRLTRFEYIMENAIRKAMPAQPKPVRSLLEVMKFFGLQGDDLLESNERKQETPIHRIEVEYIKPKIPEEYREFVEHEKKRVAERQARERQRREALNNLPDDRLPDYSSSPARPPVVGREIPAYAVTLPDGIKPSADFRSGRSRGAVARRRSAARPRTRPRS